jgi:hypothetical protein
VGVAGVNAAYCAPASEEAAARWLATHASTRTMMAAAGSDNLVTAAVQARVVVG